MSTVKYLTTKSKHESTNKKLKIATCWLLMPQSLNEKHEIQITSGINVSLHSSWSHSLTIPHQTKIKDKKINEWKQVII
jgi:hypothetical protein